VTDHKKDLISLLKARSLKTGDFTLASGKKSSYYIDARTTTMSAQGQLAIGAAGFAAIQTAGWNASTVGGLTLGADPVSYAIARASLESDLPLDAFTVRKEPKGHGRGRQIEGCYAENDRVVIVEDVITTGGSALTAIQVLKDAGAVITGVLAVVDRQEDGRQAIEAAGYEVQVLATIEELGIIR
jgi:orotate phosphoribosyltransferase